MTPKSSGKRKGTKKPKAPGRSREDWLEAALDALTREGEGRVRVKHLAAALGVTTGSLYWHFEDRADLVAQMLAYWHDEFTAGIGNEVSELEGTPAEKLTALARGIVSRDLNRYDSAMRAWATHEPGAAKTVRRVDKSRFTYVSKLFAEAGFSGDELRVRTRAFQNFFTLGDTVGRRRSKAKRLEDAARLVAVLTAT